MARSLSFDERLKGENPAEDFQRGRTQLHSADMFLFIYFKKRFVFQTSLIMPILIPNVSILCSLELIYLIAEIDGL